MKTVLLPTDLSVQSLWPIHHIVKESQNQHLTVQVIHMLSLPTGIGELLSLRENKLYSAIPENFLEAFQMLCNKYKTVIEKIEFKFIYCDTSRYLNNFIESNNISEVYLLDKYKYAEPLAQSQNFTPYFNKCKVPVHKVSLQAEVSQYQNLSVLLNGEEKHKPAPSNRIAKTTVSYS